MLPHPMIKAARKVFFNAHPDLIGRDILLRELTDEMIVAALKAADPDWLEQSVIAKSLEEQRDEARQDVRALLEAMDGTKLHALMTQIQLAARHASEW